MHFLSRKRLAMIKLRIPYEQKRKGGREKRGESKTRERKGREEQINSWAVGFSSRCMLHTTVIYDHSF